MVDYSCRASLRVYEVGTLYSLCIYATSPVLQSVVIVASRMFNTVNSKGRTGTVEWYEPFTPFGLLIY